MSSRKIHSAFAEAFVNRKPMRKLGKNALTGDRGAMYEVKIEGSTVSLNYWGTPVVSQDTVTGVVTLTTNGYQTVTTKALINAALAALGSYDVIRQTDHVWNIHRVGLWTVEFKDNMTVKISNSDKSVIPCTEKEAA